MQINMFTEKSINVTIGRAPQQKRQFAQAQNGAFDGPQCKVTISKEGRKRSGQSDRYTEKSAQRLKEEKIMLRQRDESKEPDESDKIINEYSNLLEEINKTIKSMQKSNMAGADKETIKKKQEVMRAIGNQRQKQLEANQKKKKEAQQMAMQTSELQDEIDENNSNLLIMLKSIEESEEAEEEREGGKTDSSDAKAEKSVSDAITNSATQFAASSMRRQLDVVGMINSLYEEGIQSLARADEIARNAFSEAESLKDLLNDENYTDDEKKAAVISYGSKMARDSIHDLEIILGKNYTDDKKEKALKRYCSAIMSNSDFADYRRHGMQMVRDAKECKSNHIAGNPLQGMEETRSSMIQSAADAAVNEATQGKLDETSQELEDAVEELIDERNDIDHVEDPEEEKDKEQQKEIGDLTGQEEQLEEDEKNPMAVNQANY